ncbi:MAG: tRNA (adenosine(37)-N6)-threonylcarbamoyltransferase complex ATPase subunit type 1 TsaE, partial [Gemmatimonadetes bacterium]|nr:tRNA (adenosine(37)-N6)-threonylcarbamoyltransferase complex ATPase subunit type 1 TsaE [Gemmatimonadota bacterium]
KTTLAQAICAGYGVRESVTSPTFALVHEYQAPRGPVLHLDLYRLEDERALESIGLDELLARPALVLVEWPERAPGRLPSSARRLELGAGKDPAHRTVREVAS